MAVGVGSADSLYFLLSHWQKKNTREKHVPPFLENSCICTLSCSCWVACDGMSNSPVQEYQYQKSQGFHMRLSHNISVLAQKVTGTETFPLSSMFLTPPVPVGRDAFSCPRIPQKSLRQKMFFVRLLTLIFPNTQISHLLQYCRLSLHPQKKYQVQHNS